jgi:hypothetical protein
MSKARSYDHLLSLLGEEFKTVITRAELCTNKDDDITCDVCGCVLSDTKRYVEIIFEHLGVWEKKCICINRKACRHCKNCAEEEFEKAEAIRHCSLVEEVIF